MSRAPRVFVLVGVEEYLSDPSERTVLAVYSNHRAASNAQADVDSYGWNKTKNKPADWETEDETDDEVIHFDTTNVYEKPLLGAEKVIQRKKKKR